jgi:hypothetical protein
MERAQEVVCATIVTGCDMAKMLELVEEALDTVAQLVGDSVMRDEDLAEAEGWDDAAAPVSAMSLRKAFLS